MIRRSMPFLLIMLGLLLGACQSTDNGQQLLPPPSTDSPVIFRLGSDEYRLADFEQRLERDTAASIMGLLAQGKTRAEVEQEAIDFDVRNQIFEQWLQDLLLARYARQNGIGVDAANVDAEVLGNLAPADNSQFIITTDERMRSANQQVTLEVIARHTRAPMLHLRQIIVADQATAEALQAELAGGARFATLAAQHSLDPSAQGNGGDPGWLAIGSLPPELEEAAAASPLNTVSIVSSGQGYHVFEVLDRNDDRPFSSFNELRATPNAQEYYEATFVPWFAELRATAEDSGDLVLAENFDPNSAALPFPEGTP